MEDSFDLGKLLRNHQKKHKSRPSQFGSVAGGVLKRLETNIKHRKSSRLTFFDNIRNLSKCESPAPVSNKQSKVEHRRQQLEKWKEQKEKQKKEAATQKKKPFVAGVAHAPLKFVPPPPIKPSTSGRVTRSQTTRYNIAKELKAMSQSFAPKNASFRPPEIKNVTKLPSLVPAKTNKVKKHNITFDPILPTTQKESTQTAKTAKPTLVETKPTRKQPGSTKQTKLSPKKNKTVKVSLQSSSSSESEPIGKKNKMAKAPLQSSSLNKMEPIDKKNKKTNIEKETKMANIDSRNKMADIDKKNKMATAPLQSSSSSEMEPIVEVSPILNTRSTRKSLPAPSSPIIISKTPRKSVQKESKTPKNPVPKSESSSEERLRSPKSIDSMPSTPEQFVEDTKKISPCVTMSRGKDNARKEMKKKLEEGLLDEDASDMDSVDHFRQQLASEIKRMTEMCETWDKISEQTVLPEAVQEAILSAVGLARLLMSQKLAQFGSLVERCARPEHGQAIVTPADLHGFWDMVFMQVENVDMRFKKLEELRSHGWVEEKPVEIKKKVVKGNVKKVTKPTGGPSRLREMIAAARKAKKEKEEAPTQEPTSLTPASADSKTFDAGFFSVRSPIRSPAAPSSPHLTPASKSSLLKCVLSNEAKKSANKSSASFAMLRASVMGKNMEYEGIAPIPQTPLTPINLYATPGRSILKATNTDKKSTRKSIKVVLFDRSDIEAQDSSYTSTQMDIQEMKTSYISAQTEIQEIRDELQTDSGISSMDIENKEKVDNKENSRRKSKLVRQDASEWSPVMTRSRRKSVTEDAVTPRRSSRKALKETEENVEENTKRSMRRRKSQKVN